MAVSSEIVSALWRRFFYCCVKYCRDEASTGLLRETVAESCSFSVKMKASGDKIKFTGKVSFEEL